MPAIKIHHTPTTDRDWKTSKAIRADAQDPDYYGQIYAWQHLGADPTIMASYGYPHHEVNSAGDPGAACIEACTAWIEEINLEVQSTEVNLTAAHRDGVYSHLAAHLVDAGVDPPDLEPWPEYKRQDPELERRSWPILEFRVLADEDDPEKPPRIEGHAAVFNVWSLDLGGFREMIEPGAFNKTIQDADVRALFNHSPDFVLGRSTAGTLELSEDDIGLAMRIYPPETQAAQDLMVSIDRGDITQMSFGFRTIKDRWEGQGDSLSSIKRILEEVELVDVSLVTYPAYPQTSAQVRSRIESLADTDPHPGSDSDQGTQEGAPGESEGSNQGQVHLGILRKRLDLADKM